MMLVGLPSMANVGNVTSVPPYDPSTVSGLVLWLKADSLSLANNDPVSTWTDSSSAGNNATGTTTTRPLYKTSIVNGKPAILFDGSDDFLTLGTEISLPANFVVLVVYQTSGDCCLVGAASVNNQWRVGESGGNILSTFDGAGGNSSSTLSVARTVWNQVSYYRTAGSIYFFEGTTNLGSGGSVTASKLGMVGKLGSPSALITTGYIAEVLVYDNAIAGGDHTAVVTHLRSKYGL